MLSPDLDGFIYNVLVFLRFNERRLVAEFEFAKELRFLFGLLS